MAQKPYISAAAVLGAAVLLIFSCGTLKSAGERSPERPVPNYGAVPFRPEESPPAVRALDRAVAAMTTMEKIAQHFIIWIPRNIDEEGIEALKGLRSAGYILYPWNYASVADVRSLTSRLGAAAPLERGGFSIKPFLCADQEGGRVAAFRFKEFPDQPPAFLLGALGDPALVEAAAFRTALQLRYLGVNMNLAPVADLYHRGDNSIIGDRSFGPDPRAAGAAVAAYVGGMHLGGIIPTVKHFPGHGISAVDSHTRLPVADASVGELRKRELVPFAAGIRAGAPVVMTAHILYPAIDPDNPATLSAVILEDLLRGELDFQGIILTDGFEMGALAKNFSRGESLARALEAGVNLILLYNNYDPAEMMNLAEELLREGRIDMNILNRNVRKILEVKQAYGLLETLP